MNKEKLENNLEALGFYDVNSVITYIYTISEYLKQHDGNYTKEQKERIDFLADIAWAFYDAI